MKRTFVLATATIHDPNAKPGTTKIDEGSLATSSRCCSPTPSADKPKQTSGCCGPVVEPEPKLKGRCC